MVFFCVKFSLLGIFRVTYYILFSVRDASESLLSSLITKVTALSQYIIDGSTLTRTLDCFSLKNSSSFLHFSRRAKLTRTKLCQAIKTKLFKKIRVNIQRIFKAKQNSSSNRKLFFKRNSESCSSNRKLFSRIRKDS